MRITYDDSYLWYECGNPDDIVDRIWKEALEHVSLTVDLPENKNTYQCNVILSDCWLIYKVFNKI